GQIITPAGDLLWQEDSHIITTYDNVEDISELVLDSSGNNIYFACSVTRNNHEATYLQKMVDGTPVWGDQGILMDSESTDNISEFPVDLCDTYLVTDFRNHTQNSKEFRVYRFDENGGFPNGWENEGVSLFIDNTSSNREYSFKAASNGDNLLCALSIIADQPQVYRYSVLDENGALLIDNLPLFEENSQQTCIDIASGSGFTVVATNVINNSVTQISR
ncbi:MAG: hypothetical protein JXR56_09455, partial [Candidatus Cloacimonetes bacterium]|nr:hypothetical protein [Candidatus Cloacimonadota bacterium]